MTTFAERLAAARARLSELPEHVTVVQAGRMLAGAGNAAQMEWMHLLNAAVASGELASELVTLPAHRYSTLASMERVEKANQKPRTERRIKLSDIESWLERIGGPVPPWRAARAEVVEPGRTRRAIAKELERRHIRG